MAKKVRIWVDKGYAKKLKAEAALMGINRLKYTKKLNNCVDSINDVMKSKKKKNDVYEWFKI